MNAERPQLRADQPAFQFGAKRPGEIDLEIFSCAGGMAAGFGQAGLVFDMAVDMAKDHVDSYERNLGHRQVCMDARDLLRMTRQGWRVPVRLLVGDPPCTPWSRAGKRKGTDDERDMLRDTAEIIELLRPRAYLIGNVPGLEDSGNLRVVQDVIGGLSRFGYCVRDFATLDAADFGVPQHRVRPFWYGHLHGPCVRWEPPTHGDPKEIGEHLPGIDPLLPWVTCGQALGHLSKKELGRMVTLRKRSQNGKQHTSLMDEPARVVGTSNLSDGNVVLPQSQRVNRLDRPSSTVTVQKGTPPRLGVPLNVITKPEDGAGHQPHESDKPAHTICAGGRGGAQRTMVISDGHPPSTHDEPAQTVRASDGGGARRTMVLPRKGKGKAKEISGGASVDRTNHQDAPARGVTTQVGWAQPLVLNDRHAPATLDAPAPTMGAKSRGQGSQILALHDAHAPSELDQPSKVITDRIHTVGGEILSLADMPSEGKRYKRSTQGPQSQRVAPTDRPATTVQCREDRQGSGMMVEWMHERPATTVMRDPRLAAPGHKDKDWKKQGERSRSSQKAVLLSPKAAAILQGFPESWVFCGKTKKAVWSQIGQAMPPALAAAVGRAVLRQFAETVDDGKPESYVPYTPAPVQPPAASAPEQVSVGLDLTVQPLPPDEIAARRAELQRQGFAVPEVA